VRLPLTCSHLCAPRTVRDARAPLHYNSLGITEQAIPLTLVRWRYNSEMDAVRAGYKIREHL
jgi:hypothetical protein